MGVCGVALSALMWTSCKSGYTISVSFCWAFNPKLMAKKPQLKNDLIVIVLINFVKHYHWHGVAGGYLCKTPFPSKNYLGRFDGYNLSL